MTTADVLAQRSCMDSHVSKTLWVQLLISLEDTITQQPPNPLALIIFMSPQVFPEPYIQEWFVDVSIGTGLHNSVF